MASQTQSFVYALGRIEARFPGLSVEKEFAQVVGREESAGKTDRQVLHEVLSRPENRYLVRQMCWVLSIQGLDTYLLYPRDPLDLDRLVESIRAQPGPDNIDLVVGTKGPIAPLELCNGLMVPLVAFDNIYHFGRDAFIKSIPAPKEVKATDFRPSAEEVFDRIMQMTDNAGATDEHRALNYLAVRYAAIYAKAAEQFARDFSLTGIEARPSSLSGTRNIIKVILSFTNRNTDFAERFFVCVDVTEEFPFLVTKLSPYVTIGSI
jgi:hypothetical protein